MTPARDPFLALFEPRGIVVAGASTHPGKFGFVALHNILSAGYQGKVFATNREGADVLGVTTVADIDELRSALADQQPGVNVIVMRVRESDWTEGGAFWQVGVPEVSERSQMREARERMDIGLKAQRRGV